MLVEKFKKVKQPKSPYKDKITSFFCIIDDILKEIKNLEDTRRKASDNEIITTTFITANNFLEKSKFNRYSQNLENILYELFHLIVSFYKKITCEMNYIIDSIPVPICQNRINRSKIAKGKQYKRLHNKYAKLFYIIDFQLVKK